MPAARGSTAVQAVTVVVLLAASVGCSSPPSRKETRGLARTCGTVTLRGRAFLVEIVDGRATCGRARFVLRHARFREHSGVNGWMCGFETPAYGFTSLVFGCDGRRSALQAVPADAVARIGAACRRFAGPGDDLLHAVDLRVRGISCATGKHVVETCNFGKSCAVGKRTWSCVRPRQKPALGYGERCTSGTRLTSIVWLD